jgi:type II secretory pathway component PulF
VVEAVPPQAARIIPATTKMVIRMVRFLDNIFVLLFIFIMDPTP